MSYSNIPIASARPLADTSDKSTNEYGVVQAHAEEHENRHGSMFYNYNEPTIAVSASDVMVQPTKQQHQQHLTTPLYNALPQQIMHPRIHAFKERRKRRQKVAAVTGFAVGLILVGPVIGVVAGAVAHGVVKSSGRARQRHMEKQCNSMDRPFKMGCTIGKITLHDKNN